MAKDFDQELLQSYLSRIVETRKEQEMLEAEEHGLVSKVAKMIDDSLYRFTYKGLKVSTCHGDVRYWLANIHAGLVGYSHGTIEVVFCLACLPTDIKGNIKLTKKEAEVATELQQIWDKAIEDRYFYNLGQYKEASRKLSELTHHLRCYKEIRFCYDINDYYAKVNLLDNHYDLSGLSDKEFANISTRNLERLDKIFKMSE